MDTIKSVAADIDTKLISVAARNAAQKVLTEAAESSAQKDSQKTGQLVGEKIYYKLTKSENKGDEIF